LGKKEGPEPVLDQRGVNEKFIFAQKGGCTEKEKSPTALQVRQGRGGKKRDRRSSSSSYIKLVEALQIVPRGRVRSKEAVLREEKGASIAGFYQ